MEDTQAGEGVQDGRLTEVFEIVRKGVQDGAYIVVAPSDAARIMVQEYLPAGSAPPDGSWTPRHCVFVTHDDLMIAFGGAVKQLNAQLTEKANSDQNTLAVCTENVRLKQEAEKLRTALESHRFYVDEIRTSVEAARADIAACWTPGGTLQPPALISMPVAQVTSAAEHLDSAHKRLSDILGWTSIEAYYAEVFADEQARAAEQAERNLKKFEAARAALAAVSREVADLDTEALSADPSGEAVLTKRLAMALDAYTTMRSQVATDRLLVEAYAEGRGGHGPPTLEAPSE